MFTTPTHLGSNIIPANLKNLIGKKAFDVDFSEVDGLDNLKNPKNCIKKSQELAAKIYGTKSTFYLTNGSSSGIIALMLSVLKEKDKVLIARNTHESVFNGLVLTGAIPVWLLPEYDAEFDISKGITLSQIKDEYKNNPDIKALIITSPTYEGIVSDVKEIADFCKEKGIIFIVDEAHGALFPFSKKLPDSAITLGADACVHSLHKNTPALTGSALLHISQDSQIDEKIIQKNLNLINSTSPSWILIASIEGAINYLSSKRAEKDIDEIIEDIENFKKQNTNFKFLEAKNHDITKLLIAKDNYTGEEFSEFLFEHNTEDELVTNRALLCLCGIGTTKKKLKKLSNVLKKMPNRKMSIENNTENPTLPIMKFTPKEAHLAKKQLIKKELLIGKIIGENIAPYPPCIPLLIEGEIIEEKHLKFLDDFVNVINV